MVLSVLPGVVADADGDWRSWWADGNQEPGVEGWDTDGDYMWQTANNGQDDRIYFDAVLDQQGQDVTLVNPDGTAIRTHLRLNFHAYLGFWRDCNNDGFIGDAESAKLQYPAANPEVDASICPTSSIYNDGTNIDEFLSIGPGARDVTQDDTLCPERNGDENNQPRAQDGQGVLEGGENVVCTGERSKFVQDDFAKVWHDFGLTTDEPTPSSLLFPLPDGTFRDTNGHFKYVNSLTFDAVRTSAPGLWPNQAQEKNADPANGNQCDEQVAEGGYDAGGGDGASADQIATNAIQGATDDTCSPIPNLRWVDAAVLGKIAYPGHLAENRLNDSENPDGHPTPITEPYTHEKHDTNDQQGAHQCDLKTENGGDDWDDDPNDGDPFYGGDVTGDPVSFAQAYYGPQDPGPSLEGTNSNVLGGLFFTAASAEEGRENADCSKGGAIGNLELHGDAGQSAGADKVAADTTLSYFQDTSFNPSTAPGDPTGTTVPDTDKCVPINGATFGAMRGQCWTMWDSDSQWTHSRGTTSLDPSATLSLVNTFYADVSFGEDTFDPKGDGPFRVGQGYFEAPSGLPEGAALPAGSDDAHTYGDAQCAGITALDVSGDDLASFGDDLKEEGRDDWSCDRNLWVGAGQVDCNVDDEITCWSLPKVGDPYDLRDVECHDNDVAETSTTDEDGPVGQAGETSPVGNREDGALADVAPDASADDPGRSCEKLSSPPPAK